MNLALALLVIYPTLNLETDVIVQDDGDGLGPHIVYLNPIFPMPTEQQLIDANVIAVRRLAKRNLKDAAILAMASGFNSSASGASFRYATDADSLVALILAKQLGGAHLIECTNNTNGNEVFKNHTAAQITLLMTDLKAFRDGIKQQYQADLALIP